MNSTATPRDIQLAATLHHVVGQVAERLGPSGRPANTFGPEKVFVSAVWDILLLGYPEFVGDCTLGEFKLWLTAAMRMVDESGAPLVVLARADLPGAMDPTAVSTSEIAYSNATFHFIVRRSSSAYRVSRR